MPVSEAALRAQKKYDRANRKPVKVSFHNENDADILKRLGEKKDTETKQGYVKRLIREDIKKSKDMNR